MDTIVGTIWVCIDCLFAREGDGTAGEPDREPWCEIEPGYSVTYGLTYEEHECDPRPDYVNEDGCDCERKDFSGSRCDGCGSQLAGERYAYTLWKDE